MSKNPNENIGTQAEFLRRMATMQMDAMQGFMGMLQNLTHYNAVFKATVQSNGRITIPEAERQALNIEDGDLVQVILVPLEKGKDSGSRSNIARAGGETIE